MAWSECKAEGEYLNIETVDSSVCYYAYTLVRNANMWHKWVVWHPGALQYETCLNRIIRTHCKNKYQVHIKQTVSLNNW